ncbi:hypothetical protein [Chitinophaga defluvii]|uniref:DUF4468 domain-containing protein n=1 Tax=Chitinophaga defluvii TaxID=3163343 RepID=A0ABV2TAP6_9BACT
MKSIFLIISLLAGSIAGISAQNFSGGIQLVSGQKVVAANYRIIPEATGRFYSNYKPRLIALVEEHIVANVKQAVDQNVRELNITLPDVVTLEAVNEPGGFALKVWLKGCRATFKVTTPNATLTNPFGGLGRDFDPKFVLTWDQALVIAFTDINSVTTFYPKNPRSETANTAIHKPRLMDKFLGLADNVSNSFTAGEGFFPDLNQASVNIAAVLNTTILMAIGQVLKSKPFLDELKLDGDEKLTVMADIRQGNIIAKHPHSYAGTLARSAKTTLSATDAHNPVLPVIGGDEKVTDKLVKKPSGALNPQPLPPAPAQVKPSPKLNPQPLPPAPLKPRKVSVKRG